VRFSETVLDAITNCARNPASRIYQKLPGSTPIRLVYGNSDDESPAIKLLVDIWVRYADEKAVDLLGDELPPRFMLVVASAMTRKKRLIETDLSDYADILMSYDQDQAIRVV
jgi:hypothetical protein